MVSAAMKIVKSAQKTAKRVLGLKKKRTGGKKTRKAGRRHTRKGGAMPYQFY